MSGSQIAVIAGVAAVAVAVLGLLFEMRACREQLWLQMFAEYTKRYAQITEKLPSEARRPSSEFSLESLDPLGRGEVLNAARAYINLCAEEFYLRGRGRIDRKTWSIWESGMRDTARLPWIQQTWTLVEPEYAYYKTFAAFFDRCAATAD